MSRSSAQRQGKAPTPQGFEWANHSVGSRPQHSVSRAWRQAKAVESRPTWAAGGEGAAVKHRVVSVVCWRLHPSGERRPKRALGPLQPGLGLERAGRASDSPPPPPDAPRAIRRALPRLVATWRTSHPDVRRPEPTIARRPGPVRQFEIRSRDGEVPRALPAARRRLHPAESPTRAARWCPPWPAR